jgi:NAD(P)-dependent dehydrogenase (short-subunit alcohol dehydrogenase family)
MTPENQPVEDLTGAPRAVVTGASSGIGLAAAEELARRGWEVALVARDPARLAQAADRVRQAGGTAATYQADFAVLDDVRKLADQLRTAYPRIDVLANNAGGLVLSGERTVDGFERTIQTNHLAPFLLTHLLLEPLAGGRIVNTASDAHNGGDLGAQADLFALPDGYRGMSAYGGSKQANILFTAEAARRWPNLLTTCFHPGVVRTRFARESKLAGPIMRVAPFLRSPAKGAYTLVWLATEDREKLTNGAYYIDRRERRPKPTATDPALAARLWDSSLDALDLR